MGMRKRSRRAMTMTPALLLPLLFLIPENVNADMLPNPNFHSHTNPDGSSCEIHSLGDSEYTYEADKNDFTVLTTPDGWKAYAKRSTITGDLEATPCLCGTSCDPSKMPGLHVLERPTIEKITEGKRDCLACRRSKEHPVNKFLQRAIDRKKESHSVENSLFGTFEQKGKIIGGKGRRTEEQRTAMKNLVVVIRFSDHLDRVMPPISDFEILFNKLGGDSRVCDTGSVRDVFRFNSYEEFDLVSTVAPLVDVPQTEAYCANNERGIGVRTQEAIREALTKLDDIIDFSEFDEDGDGYIDAIAFVHSGYGAEFGGDDCYQTDQMNRIWSHQWRLLNRPWISKTGVKVADYHLTSGLWDKCGSEIARIGVIAHETGHFLGLPDLYDGVGGSGIGSYGLMGNSWGFAGQQKHPPMLSAWSKIRLGWVDPVPITHDGTYYLDPIHSNREVYVIKEKYAPNEYLLIENRQRSNNPYVFEDKLPQPGLAIFHIDDDSSYTTEGHPGQSGWPLNKNHYRVAMLQADSKYELETLPSTRGDAGDVFHGHGVDSIGPYGTSAGEYFPNTNSYGGNTVVSTGISIHSISPPQTTMSFQISGIGAAPANAEGQLVTTFAGGNYQAGNMFNLLATQSLTVNKIDIHTRETSEISVMVFSRTGSYVGHESSPPDWELHGIIEVTGRGDQNPTPVEGFDPIHVDPNVPKGVYLTIQNGVMDYSSSGESGEIFASNGDLSMTVGTGNRHAFQQFWRHRVFNGNFYYTLDANTDAPTKAPTPQPIPSPTPAARNQEPTSGTVSTSFAGGNGQSGVMFDIEAVDSLELTSIDINTESTSPSYVVELWTIEGSYVNHESSSDGWVHHGDLTVEAKGEGNPTALTGFSPIRLNAGETLGVYITDREGDIKYSSSLHGQGTVLSQDQHFKVLEGSGCRYPFGKSYTPRVVNANFHYKLVIGASAPSPSGSRATPLSTPTQQQSTPPKEGSITTTWDAGNGQAGNMFTIKPQKKLIITSFDLHCDKTEVVHLLIYMKQGSYIGFESSKSDWGTPICETDVMGQGLGNPTPVPENCFDPINVDPSSEYSFYITFTTGCIEYTKGEDGTEGQVHVQNSDLVVYNGIGVRYEFGGRKGINGVYRPRLWNGNIKYTIQQQAPELKSDISSFSSVEPECHMRNEDCRNGSECCSGLLCKEGVCDFMSFW